MKSYDYFSIRIHSANPPCDHEKTPQNYEIMHEFIENMKSYTNYIYDFIVLTLLVTMKSTQKHMFHSRNHQKL